MLLDNVEFGCGRIPYLLHIHLFGLTRLLGSIE